MNNVLDPQIDEFAQLLRRAFTDSERPSDAFDGQVESLDEEIQKVGPWWLGNYLVNCDDEQTKAALSLYLHEYWPDNALTIDQMISATQWRRTANGGERDFGGD